MSPASADFEQHGSGAAAIQPPAAMARPLRWGSALAVSAVLAVALIGLLIWSATRSGGDAAAPGALAVSATDYAFTPERISWQAGQRATITFTNDTQGRPGKSHELMIGRRPVMGRATFGLRPAGGFETDFFDGVNVRLTRARGLSMAMSGGGRISRPGAAGGSGAGMSPKMKMGSGQTMGGQMSPSMKMAPGQQMGGGMKMGGGMQMGGGAAGAENGLMLVLRPGGTVTLSFTVPNRPGRWELACFQQNGQHYTNGMKGVIDVRPPARG